MAAINKMPTLLGLRLSTEWADSIYFWANIGTIVAALSAFAFGAISFQTSRIRDAYADQRREQYEGVAKAAKEDAERLAIKVAPRTVTPQSKAAMVALARQLCPQIGRVVVTASGSNHEAQNYAYAFVEALREVGIVADLQLPIPGLTAEVQGVLLGVRDSQNIPDQARMMGRILDAGGVQYRYAPMKPDFFPGNAWALVIGAKPD